MLIVPPKISQRSSITPLSDGCLLSCAFLSSLDFHFLVLIPQIISTGSPESGLTTSLPSLARIWSFNNGKYSVHTFHRSHVSYTTERIPSGYNDSNLEKVSISLSLVPIHMTECSVAGTLAPIRPFAL